MSLHDKGSGDLKFFTKIQYLKMLKYIVNIGDGYLKRICPLKVKTLTNKNG